jgi:[CysO sulfur-carrier protein]-S-L-cysteine hydrolase
MTREPPPADGAGPPSGLTLPRSVVDALLEHARAEAPNEACGLLAGDAGRGTGSAFHPARNALASPYRFDVDPGDLVRVLDEIHGAGLDLVAIFHSHPRSPAVPSALDRREASYRVSQLIVSLQGDEPEVRAWWLEDDGSRELRLLIAGT